MSTQIGPPGRWPADGGWMAFTILSSVRILVPLYDIYRAMMRGRRRTVPPEPRGNESA
jgi:hypothetical protein